MLKVYIKLSLFVALFTTFCYLGGSYLKDIGLVLPVSNMLFLEFLWATVIFCYFIRLMFLYANDFNK